MIGAPLYALIDAASDPLVFGQSTTTWVTVLAAILIVGAILALLLRDSSKTSKSAIMVCVGIAAFLLVGAQWSTFKVSTSGIEVSKAAKAAADVADQIERLSKGVDSVRIQVAIIADHATTPAQARQIRGALDRAPRPDLQKLNAARQTLRSLK